MSRQSGVSRRRFPGQLDMGTAGAAADSAGVLTPTPSETAVNGRTPVFDLDMVYRAECTHTRRRFVATVQSAVKAIPSHDGPVFCRSRRYSVT